MDLQRFRTLSPHHRALVAIAVLLDGREAGAFLENDAASGGVLSRAARDMSALPPDLRMPSVGTMLRSAIRDMGRATRLIQRGGE